MLSLFNQFSAVFTTVVGSIILLAALSFRFVPTFILLDDNGEELWRETGSFEPERVVQELQNYQQLR